MKIEKSRFHIKHGPVSLFKRISHIFQEVKLLKTHGSHFKARMAERKIPEKILDYINNFSQVEWNLVAAEVRNDTGKFINASWEIKIDGIKYWVVVGFNNTIETIIEKNSDGLSNIVTEGEFYSFVNYVNIKLMENIK